MYSSDHEKTYDYQLQLVNRRWQYFATYLFILGLCLNAIPKDIWQFKDIKDFSSLAFLTVSLGIIILGVVFTQLISLATKRIEKLELFVGKNKTITAINLDGRFLGHSETLLLYFTIYIFSLPWLIVLFYNRPLVFAIGILILISNLFFLKWKALSHPQNDESI